MAAAALLALAVSLPAAAESRSAEDLTPLGLTRGADVVAVVERDAGVLRVTTRLRGPVLEGQALELGGDPPLPPVGARVLGHFAAGTDGALEVVGGPLGLLALPDDPSGAATTALFRVLTGADGEQPAVLRAALVAAVASATPRVRAGAAHDLWREPGLLASATASERSSLVEAFRAAEGAPLEHLARVLGRLRAPESGPLLADALVGAHGEHLAAAVGRALRDLADDAAVARLAGRVADAAPPLRERLAYVLGATGRAAARAPLQDLLDDPDPAVRVSAAAALGGMRSSAVAPALLARLRGGEGEPRVRRALVWALAQCDDDDAWDALRTTSASDADERLRRFAADTLRRPRRPFLR